MFNHIMLRTTHTTINIHDITINCLAFELTILNEA